jgi:hypothetical protein
LGVCGIREAESGSVIAVEREECTDADPVPVADVDMLPAKLRGVCP